MVITAVRNPEEEPKPEKQLTYRERALKLAENAPPFDAEAFKTDLFESDEELEAFIEDIYRYRRSYNA